MILKYKGIEAIMAKIRLWLVQNMIFVRASPAVRKGLFLSS
jgi:hypothetical protein